MSRSTQLLLLFFLVLYLAFPTHNSTLDSFYYAASVRYGVDLFLPHHLLYNATGYVIKQLAGVTGLQPDVLTLLKALNAVAAVACLCVLAQLLRLLKIPAGHIFGWVLIAGASFGVWRFATENEVYVLPILLSLCGSYFWLRYFLSRKALFLALAGLFAALACLYHQLHVFWWLGLLIGTVWVFRNFRLLLVYSLPALLVPFAYVLVLVLDQNQAITIQNLTHFVLHDFYSGSAGSSFGISNFIMTAISLVRTFLQVHGLMAYLPPLGWWWFLPAIIVVVLFIWALLKKPFQRNLSVTYCQVTMGRIHLLILFLHLFFAWYAVGNAEFMVMIPFLLPLLPWLPLSESLLKKAGAAMLVWNFCYGIFPAWHYKLSASTELAQLAKQNPETLFVLDDATKVNNEYFYHFGIDGPPNLIKSPTLRAAKNEDPKLLREQIEQQIASGKKVLTDCIVKTKVVTRSSMVTEDADAAFFAAYRVVPADSFATFYGKHYLHRVHR